MNELTNPYVPLISASYVFNCLEIQYQARIQGGF